FDRLGLDVEVSRLQTSGDAMRIDFHADCDSTVHRDRQRLSTAHAAQTSCEGERAGQGAAEALFGYGDERLIGALEDALGADVDPGPRGHLSVHHQTFGL